MDTYELIFKLSIVLAVGFIGSLFARKLKLPNVSGFLVLGLILGPSLGIIFKGYPGFITLEENEALSFISEIALAFIAFSIGSEFAIKSIKKMGRAIITMTTFEVLGAVLVVFLVLFFIPKPADIMNGYHPFSKENLAFGLVIASMSAATAPAATLMVIRQYRAYGPVTKAILPITALDDIYGIVVFGFFISIAQILMPQGVVTVGVLSIFKPFIEVFGSIFIGIAVGWIISKLANKFDRIRDDIQIIALFSILLSIGLISVINTSLESVGIHFSQLLANIFIGTMIANLSKNPQRSFTAINDLSTPFYVMFFTLAGASLNLAILKQDSLIIWLSLAYVIARGGGKILGVMAGAYIVNAEPTVKKYLGLGLLPQGGVSIGLLVIVQAQMRTLYPTISTIIMLSILVYETFGPVFAKLAITKAKEVNGLDSLETLSSLDGIEG